MQTALPTCRNWSFWQVRIQWASCHPSNRCRASASQRFRRPFPAFWRGWVRAGLGLSLSMPICPVDSDGFVRQSNLFSAGTPPSLSFLPLSTRATVHRGSLIKPVDSRSASHNYTGLTACASRRPRCENFSHRVVGTTNRCRESPHGAYLRGSWPPNTFRGQACAR